MDGCAQRWSAAALFPAPGRMHFTRVNAGAVDAAAEHLFEMDEPVPVVEVQAAEHFVRPVTQLRGEELARGGGRFHGGTRAQAPSQ